MLAMNYENKKRAAGAYLAVLEHLQIAAPQVASAIIQELRDQRSHLKLIASENYSSLTVQLAMGNLLTDKYSEGFVKHRFYGGCENVDSVEALAAAEAKAIFGADHAYVQPHSGADANLIAFYAILAHRILNQRAEKIDQLDAETFEKIRLEMGRQKLMGLSLSCGGHLTHGYRHNVSAKMFHAVSYEVNRETEAIDYDQLLDQVKKEKPLILIAGYSAYPKLINFKIMKEIASSVNATLMVDMAHFAGLVAGGVMTGEYHPVPYADVITSTTHKTLRGPRGGMILCTNEYKEVIDKGCPMVMGGPLPHVMAAKAIAFKEANTDEFKKYAKQIVLNSKALAKRLMDRGCVLYGSGTENHLVVLNVAASFGLTGRQAELLLGEAMMTVNRNMVPWDQNGAWYTSGVRLGTAALTTRGLFEKEMEYIADLIVDLLKEAKPAEDSRAKAHVPAGLLSRIQKEISELLNKFPLYPELLIQ
ncbi:MAG: serine hydroxymethyltransferase [Simkaniaceae bacterium]|nr:serine hydroxymethyltransferase [Simkaniaceae bacterium]